MAMICSATDRGRALWTATDDSQGCAMFWRFRRSGVQLSEPRPGVRPVVDTPLHKDVPQESLTTRQAIKTITKAKDIVDAVL
jgi:hypothetical protein